MTVTPNNTDLADAEFERVKQFGSLDGLRCFSVLAVVWHHTRGNDLEALSGAGRGFLGVDLFFAISGFLIVTLLLREIRTAGSMSLRNFYIRRSLRIFPLFYGLLLVMSLYFGLARESKSATSFFAELPFYVSYTSNLIVGSSLMAISWSLSAEEQFYLIWPPIEKFFGQFVVPVLVLVLILNQLINFRIIDPLLYTTIGLGHSDLKILQVTFTPICLGVALAHMLNTRSGFRVLYRLLGSKKSSMLWLLALLFLANTPNVDISGLHRLLIHIAMTALIGSCVIREDHFLKEILIWPPIKFVGTLSYGVYLLHVVAIFISGKVLLALKIESPVLLFLLVCTTSIFLSYLSALYYEKPFLNLKQNFS
jgi:peptidoglycan/LPS O-acetylase OafA/YrhL